MQARLKVESQRERDKERVTRATTAKNERKVKRMAVESRPCGDGGEATVRCCESMAVDSFFFFFLFCRFFEVFWGYVSPSLAILLDNVEYTVIFLLESETRLMYFLQPLPPNPNFWKLIFGLSLFFFYFSTNLVTHLVSPFYYYTFSTY